MHTIFTDRLTNIHTDIDNGLHNFLALDLINIKENFSNLMQIYSFIDEIIIKVLNFKSIYKPTLIPYYYGKVKQDCGVSCYSFFEGGYVTFHIFEKRRLAYFDIVSDKIFDINNVIKFVTQICETNQFNVYTNKTINNVSSNNVFGPHYIAYGKLNKIYDIEYLLNLEETIINEIKMTPIINPVIVRDKEYIRLFIAIAESHLVLNLNKKQLKIDVFSCKMFDIYKLNNILNKTMRLKTVNVFSRLFKPNDEKN